MVENGDQKVLVEFECVWKLIAHLPNAIDELQKHRRTIGIGMMIVTVTDAMLEFMAETEPLLFDEHLKTTNRAIVWIEQEHCKGRQLSRSIPSVRAVNDNRCAHVFDFIDDANGAGQHAFDVLQPKRTLDRRQPLLIVVGRKANLFQFSQTLAHNVDIVDVQKDDFDILICIFGLIAEKGGDVRNENRTTTGHWTYPPPLALLAIAFELGRASIIDNLSDCAFASIMQVI